MVAVPAAANQSGAEGGPDHGDRGTNAEVVSWTKMTANQVSGHFKGRSNSVRHPLAEAGRGASVDYVFGDETYSLDPATKLEVYAATDDDGGQVYRVGVVTGGTPTLASSGFAVPPDSSWKYYNSGSGTATVETWKRSWWWTINKADNYKVGTVTRDYFRIYTRLQAAVLTDKVSTTNPNSSGFDQAWIEYDRSGTWPSSTAGSEFEPPQPTDSVNGAANQTITVGFKTGLGVVLGKPPIAISGAFENTYSGTLTTSTEAWHPIQRAEAGSGGVMWCNYLVNITTKKPVEFNGTRSIAARGSIDIGSTAAPGTWTILTGQRDREHGQSSCPAQ